MDNIIDKTKSSLLFCTISGLLALIFFALYSDCTRVFTLIIIAIGFICIANTKPVDSMPIDTMLIKNKK